MMSVSSLVQRAEGYLYPETAARKKASAVSQQAAVNDYRAVNVPLFPIVKAKTALLAASDT
jgi:hypothetical protein